MSPMRLLVVALCLAPAVGCSQDDDPTESHADSAVVDSLVAEATPSDTTQVDTTPTADSSPADTAIADAPADTGGCVNLVNVGDVITSTPAGTYPTFTGGTLVDGTYVLTGWSETTGGKTAHHTLLIAGGTGTWVRDVGTAPTVRNDFAISTAGSKMTVTYTCPARAPATFDYNATATTIDMGSYGAGIGTVYSYTKK